MVLLGFCSDCITVVKKGKIKETSKPEIFFKFVKYGFREIKCKSGILVTLELTSLSELTIYTIFVKEL